MKVAQELSHVIPYNTKDINYKYDIFLSYSTVNREWVGTTLLSFLEENKYKVCFADRDFHPGRSLVESMASAIFKSRKTIAVMSRDHLESSWCVDHELILTLTKMLNKDGPSDTLDFEVSTV